ncbi:MAG: SNF2-related protein, partial [bacterium]
MVVGGTHRDDNFSRIKDLASALKSRLGIPSSKASQELGSVDPTIDIEKVIKIAHRIVKLNSKFIEVLSDRLCPGNNDYISSENEERLGMWLRISQKMDLAGDVILDAIDTYRDSSSKSVQDSIEFLAKISPYLKAQEHEEHEELINIVNKYYPEELFANQDGSAKIKSQLINYQKEYNSRIWCLERIAKYEKEHEQLRHEIISEIDNFNNKYSLVDDLKHALIDELEPNVKKFCPEKSVVLARLSMLEIQSPNSSAEFFSHLDEIIQLLNSRSEKLDEGTVSEPTSSVMTTDSAKLDIFSGKIIVKAPDDEQAALPYRELTQREINQINSENAPNQEKSTSQAISIEGRSTLLKERFANYQGIASTLAEIYMEVIHELNADNAELKYPSTLNTFLSQYARQKYGRNQVEETQATVNLIRELSNSIPKYNLDELKVEAGKYLKEYLKNNSGLDSKSFGVADYEGIYESFTRTDQGSLKARVLSLKDFKAVHSPDQKFWEDLFSVNSFNQAYSEKIQSVIELAKNLSSFDNSILYNILIKTGLAEDKVFNFIDNLKDFTKFNFAVQEKFAEDFIEAVGDAVIDRLIANPASVEVDDGTVNDASLRLSSSIGVNTPASEELAIEHFGRFTDNLIRLFDDGDQELIQFIENQAVKKIWLNLFKTNPEINPQTDLEEFGIDCKSSMFMQKTYSKFKEEFEQIKNTELPGNYNTENPIKPNLMQRYVAFKLNEIGHFANWSNPGSGKTLSAIYSAMLNEANDTKTNGHNILIIGANSTIENEEEWAANVSSFDKKANLLTKSDYRSQAFKASDRNNGENNYFLYNYEAFQGDKSQSLVKALSSKTFDTIILDEVHLIKSADSKRNAQISALIQKARESNPELKLLVMSATPIVNNLDEGKEIIKVLTGLNRLDIDISKVSPKT